MADTAPIRIRLAIREDVGDILAISNHYAMTSPANFATEPEHLNDWHTTFDATAERMPWLVAETADENAVIGFAKASPWKGRCAYSYAAEVSVYVRPEHHGQGMGRRLYDALFALMRLQGFHTLLAGITIPNDASVHLHESMGMQRVAMFKDIGWKFNAWHTTAYWQMHLQDGHGAPSPIRAVDDVVNEHPELIG